MNAVYEATESFDLGALTSGIKPEVAIAGIVVCFVLAFFGMRLYKICLSVMGATGMGFAAYTLFKDGGILGDKLPAIEGINVVAILSIGTAIIGLILGIVLPKLVMFIGGVGMGCLATPILIQAFVPTAGFDDRVVIIIGVTIGVILGILMSLLFRPMYVLTTAIGSMAIAGILLASLILPGQDPMIPALVGAAIGIIPMIVQIRTFVIE